jgi:anti-sigma B factor antagonist
MKIDVHKKDNYIIIDLTGSLDIYTSLDFKSVVENNVIDKGTTVIINLENISYVDSSGIGTLIKTYNHLENLEGNFIIANLKPIIEKVFRVAGLTNYFKIIDNNEFITKYPK